MSLFTPRHLAAMAALLASAAVGLGAAAWAADPAPAVPDIHSLDYSEPRFAEAARLMQSLHEVMERGGHPDPQVLAPKLKAFAAEVARVTGTDPKAMEAHVMEEAHKMMMAHLDPAAIEHMKRLHEAGAAPAH